MIHAARHNHALATVEPTANLELPPSFTTSNAVKVTRSQHVTRPSPRSQYQKLVATGALRGDEHQVHVVERLQALHEQLINYYPPPLPDISERNSLFTRLFSKSAVEPIPLPADRVPRGLYLFGDVGTGKSMLMDLFYDTLPLSVKRKRRVHFHAFMIDVHKRVHAAKIALGPSGGDPIIPVARDLAAEANVLCFDEFQVTDIVDAMILRRLLGYLLDFGTVSVMTSNRHPDDLYKNGIQRESFIPCIELLKGRFEVINLDSGTDYRRIPRALSHVYYHPLDKQNVDEVNKIFTALATKNGEEVVHNRTLPIWGRTLKIPESTSKVAKFSFKELCGNPLSAADYLEITETFPTLFVTDVPKMDIGKKDLARRFITFIDACYESKTKLLTSSEVPIFQVFSDDPDKGEVQISDHMRSVMDDLGLSNMAVGSSSMFTGEEEIFAFARACSRLVQMGSKEWAESTGEH
ncbi:AFG1-like ATPase [Rickenella mellea]|uniref:AFG1-like ATPase n=1 Tax=Rickenella mellea TaxID=50990 RepID=A0A4R5XHU6_9AGAM|nr:AFG1-like ATPase [Rickenella mellea]